MNKKKYVVVASILFVMFILFSYLFLGIQYQNTQQILVGKMIDVIDEVKEKYPDVSMEELIQVFTSTSDSQTLQEYGYHIDDTTMNELKNQYHISIGICSLFFILFVGLEIVLYRYYEKNEQKRLQEIDAYLKDISKQKYHLMLYDNNEDELSKLHNDLYKITVMLKEEAMANEKERAALEESLENISHQIKTPLTSIRILLDNMIENPDMDASTRQEFLTDMSRQTSWISSLITTLLKLAKFDAGTVTLKDEEFSLKQCFQEIQDDLAIYCEMKHIQLKVNMKEDYQVLLDKFWNKEAWVNVIKNAIESSDYGSSVMVNVEKSNLLLKIVIIDYGKGISKKNRKHLFERFYQGDSSHPNNFGIGLSLAKEIIESENGYIMVQSKENEGTSFTIKYRI